ncbi:hypothetical protein Cgig2_008527 [Carnegiea gigantea]|uniref:Uncharacterized protein n=1 Tax=Carnegiea gigantea TaxID=171969 RepID=A0A9Q1Q6G0_9CARY|nr:hypothetical protein Cgig2_008527 [Carnegiea gigantea]
MQNISKYYKIYLNILLSLNTLVETKTSGVNVDTVCHKIGFDGVFQVDAQGFKGVIWILWRRDFVNLHVIASHEQYVTLEVQQDSSNSLPEFTWSRGNTLQTWKQARLNRGLRNKDWHLLFPEVGVRHLAIPPNLQDLNIDDFGHANNGWKWELFSNFLPPGILNPQLHSS